MTQHEGAEAVEGAGAVAGDAGPVAAPSPSDAPGALTQTAGVGGDVVGETRADGEAGPVDATTDSAVADPDRVEVGADSGSDDSGDGSNDRADDDELDGADESGNDEDSDNDDSDDDSDDDDSDQAADGGAARGRRGRVGKDRLAHLEREGEVAADFLERLLDIADLDGDIDVDVDGDRAAVAIVDSEEGQVPRRLVGPDGRVLEALQDLTRLAVQAATGERSRLMLDVAGFRAKRRSTLVDQARSAIEKVKSTGAAQSLEPMTAFERKVVHDEVAAAGMVSESEGAEPSRYVVIHPA